MPHDALWWKKEKDAVRCLLCPHRCLMTENETGLCGVRQNTAGRLITHAYNRVAALHIDPIEKKPLYHFLPGTRTLSLGTHGCNLRCLHCQNAGISQTVPSGGGQLLTPHQLVDLALKNNCPSISYTYNEPVVFYELMYNTAKLAREAGLKNILVSSGFINPNPLRQLLPLLDAANIDLKCFRSETYRNLCGAELAVVKQTLKTLLKAGVWLEITTLLIPGQNDNASEINDMCRWLAQNGFTETPLHFSRFFPAHRLSHLSPTPLSMIRTALSLAHQNGLRFVYPGNVPPSFYQIN